jgi:hypothetical protein
MSGRRARVWMAPVWDRLRVRMSSATQGLNLGRSGFPGQGVLLLGDHLFVRWGEGRERPTPAERLADRGRVGSTLGLAFLLAVQAFAQALPFRCSIK